MVGTILCSGPKHQRIQCAKKVLYNSLGLVDFALLLVIFVLNLPNGQVLFWGGNSNYRRIVINPANQKGFGLVEMTCGLVHASYSLHEWQAVKLTFYAPWNIIMLEVKIKFRLRIF